MSTVSILFNYGIVLTLIGTSVSYVVLPEDWGYHLGVLPDKWETLYPECNGKQQSPIDIKTQNVVYDGCLQRFYFSGLQRVSGVNMTLENNGHAVQVDLTGTDLEVNSGSLPGAYDIDQFHFHWGSEDSRGSEHEIDGKHYSMEMHVVMHSKTFASSKDAMKSKNGLAVLGFFIDIGCHNHEFEKLINHLGQIQHKDDHVNMASFSLTDLFPSTQHYYRYYGSLTTPPCYESVIWTIFKNHIYMSESQINRFRELGKTHFKGSANLINNYRNIQPVNNRVVKSNFRNNNCNCGD